MSIVEVSPSADSQGRSCHLTSNQQLIRVGQQKHPDVPLYEVPYVYHLAGELDVAAFRAAFVAFVSSCEVLRLRASDRDWTDIVVSERVPSVCRYLDFSADAEPCLSADDYVRARIAQPLLPTAGLYDACLIRTAETTWQWFLKLHHLITDGWNTSLLIQHLADFYQASTSESVPRHPQYSAFREHEEDNRNAPAFAAHRQWWKQRTTPLSLDGWYSPANPEFTGHHHRVVVRLTESENERLNAAAATTPFRSFSEGLSRFQVFATALSVLLFRLRPQQAVRFGVTSHGRTQPAFRETIGLFMQLLPFEVPVLAEDQVLDVVQKVETETRGFLQHSVAGCMQPDTATAFDVALNVLDLTVGDFAGLPVAASWRHNGFGDPHRKLTISAHQPQDSTDWELIFDFNLQDFPFTDHERVVEQFRGLLMTVVAVPGEPIRRLAWLSQSELRFQEQFLEDTQTLAANGAERIWDRFVTAARDFPDAQAVCGPDVTWTYAKLHRAAQQLGQELRQAGTSHVVPVICHRSEYAVLSYLAVLSADRVFLPIDADQPRERIQQLLEESTASHVLEAVGMPLLVRRQTDDPPTPEAAAPTSACYVLYTSGSTGTPNAVLVGDSALWNLLQELERLSPDAGDRCSWWTNVGFDVAIYEVFSALLYGRTLCIPADDTRQSPPRLFAWLRDEQVSSAYLPPFFVEAFAQHVKSHGVADLQRLLVGVEPIPQCTLADIAREGVTVINGYGPTEAAICATLHLVDVDDRSPGPTSIGRAVRGNQLRIVDALDEPVPPGRPGELLISGAGLALGYHNNQGLTAERFVSLADDPSGRRWYRTGDLVRLRDDGRLQFAGRIDEQIKIRGQRIEPGEILAALRAIAGVDDAVVDVCRDGAEPLLVAWICGTASADQIRGELAQRLPRYRVPARLFVQSAPLPRTANGKADRAALWAAFPTASQASQSADVSPAATDTSAVERRLLAIWREIVGSSDCDLDSNLFATGGDSLDVLRLIAEAETLGVSLTMSEVFSTPSLRELCQRHAQRPMTAPQCVTPFPVVRNRVVQHSEPLSVSSPATASQRGPTPDLTLSAAQQGMWYVMQAEQAEQTPSACLLQLVTELDGVLDPDCLAVCVQRLIVRHQALTTGIQSVDGRPQLSVTPAARMQLTSSTVGSDADLRLLARQQADHGFVMDGRELVRLHLVNVAEHHSVLMVTAHHIVMDQHSIGLILQELAVEYSALQQARTRGFLPPARPASDFAAWRQQHREHALPEHHEFWRQQLSDIHTHLELPVDRPAGVSGSSAGRLSQFCLPTATTTRARQWAAAQGVTLHTVLLTTWQILLQRYADESDFVVGVPVSRRGDSGFLDTVGYLIETLPLPCHVDASCSFEQLVHRTDATFQRAISAFTLTVSDILSLLPHLAPGTGRVPWQTMFVMQGDALAPQFGDVATTAARISDLGAAKFDLTLFVTGCRNQSELACQMEYRTCAFDEATVRRIQQHWTLLVHQLVSEPALPVGTQPFDGPADEKIRQRCHLHDWSECSLAVQPEVSVRRDVVNQIALHASARPHAMAVCCGDQQTCYASLDRRAAEIAAALEQIGVQPGHCVAVLLERSIDLVAAILGILKTGAAYVPIDPQQPAARAGGMLDDAEVAAAICQVGKEGSLADAVTQPIPFLTVAADAPAENGGQASRPSVRVPSAARIVPGLAYVMFTSGSTGRPKGVEVSRASLWESTMARQQFYAANPDVFLLLSPVWFDSSVAGLFWTLTTGGTLVLPHEDELQDVVTLGRLIATHRVTHTLCLPTVYRLLLRHAAAAITGLQTVIVAGEACVPRLVADHRHRLPSTRLYNEYGPTEASVWATCCALHDERTAGRTDAPVSIGRAVPGIHVHLLDELQRPVPVGVPGEIYLSGSRLAEGYRGQPELTAECFPVVAGTRCYRTGDRARLRSDGSLQFLGRLDTQVKIHGQRIELEEIEAVIADIPGVREAAAALAPVCGQRSPVSVQMLVEELLQRDAAETDRLLRQVEEVTTDLNRIPAADSTDSLVCQAGQEHFEAISGALEVSVDLPGSTFIATPRERQRKWLIRQSLQELLSDLNHLDGLAPAFVPGSEAYHLPRDLATARLDEQEIMEDWQTPLMRAMADYGCQAGNDVLEIGFGRGVASTFIQHLDVASHTIVEMNPHSVSDHYVPWRQRYPQQDIRLVAGRWQDTLAQLADYDAVFFHAFPMNESEFEQHVLHSATYAEHFFATAAGLLRPGGVFTYMTTEIDSLSRRHQRSLLQHFAEIQLKVVSLSVPDDTRDAWWADSMVIVRAIR